MLNFSPLRDTQPQAIERLRLLTAGMSSFGKAYLGEAALPGTSDSFPCLVVECADAAYRDDAQIIAEVMREYFEHRGSFNIAPVPPGPWWDAIEKTGVKIR